MTTMPTTLPPATARARAALRTARHTTTALVAPLSHDQLTVQVDPLMSPIVWDLAHIAHFEELWLLRAAGHAGPTDPRFDDLYDAFAHTRDARAALPLLGPDDAVRFMDQVRLRVEEVRHDPPPPDDPLHGDGFVLGMVLQHELQHQETILQTIQLAGWPYATALRPAGGAAPPHRWVDVPAGDVRMGADEEPWAYDNERPAHRVHVPAFRIARYPVTNADLRGFIADGGYGSPSLWSARGWRWRQEHDVRAPLHWHAAGDGWERLRFGVREPVPDAEPVQHVSYFEAEAYARWAGARLPTESEWERAATGACPVTANLDRTALGPLPADDRGGCPDGAMCLLGDVWEWTSSGFEAYPGFTPFPYPEYSQVFFGGDYRVLRGGSWATDRHVARVSFRNWDHPQRRQIFSGIRLAQEAR